MYWFYAAVSAGPISVVSPLAAVLNAAVPVAVGVALGERPGETASVGVVLAMFAVILVSRESPADEDVRTHRFTSKVAWLTVGSGVAFGLDFVLLHQAPVECRLWPLFFARAAATVLVFAVAADEQQFPASVQDAAAAGGRRGAAGYLRQHHHAAGDPEMDAVAGQHLDLAVPGDDGHPGDHRAARAGDPLAGARHDPGGGVGQHDRRYLTGVALALLAAIGFGVDDFVGGIASRRVAAIRVVLVSYPITMVLLGVLAAVIGGPISAGAVIWGSLGGIGQACGVWWLYAALGAGPISVVSPLTAVLTATVPVAIGIAMGERPGLVAAVGIGLAMVAVVLVSGRATDDDVTPHRFTTAVALLTIGSGVAFGLNFALCIRRRSSPGCGRCCSRGCRPPCW